MFNVENAFLIDICIGYPMGKIWFPGGMPEVNQEDVPETYLLKGEQLASVKQLIARKDSSIRRIVEGLEHKADMCLAIPNPSVTEKNVLRDGISKNDYFSIAKYWWPNPETTDGLPYIRRDGEINPECYSDESDLNRLVTFTESSIILSVAAYLFDNELYARKANELIHTWIIDSITRQTPHFQFAQHIPGREELRYAGLIEARRLIHICESIQLLRHIQAISDEEYKACKSWFSDLLQWIETSEQGQRAIAAKNNIGFWTDLQRLIYAQFSGRSDLIGSILTESVIQKINQQIDEEGRLINELSRAQPYDYVAFTLLAMAGLSAASRNGDIQLGEYSTEEGRSFQNALNWFHSSIQVNGLQEQSLALGRLTMQQQEINELKEKNMVLQSMLQKSEQRIEVMENLDSDSGHSTDGPSDVNKGNLYEALERMTKSLERSETECHLLRRDLQDSYRSLIYAAFYIRGMEKIVEAYKTTAISIEDLKDQFTVKLQDYESKINQLQEQIEEERERNLQLSETELALQQEVNTLTENLIEKQNELLDLINSEKVLQDNLEHVTEENRRLSERLKAKADELDLQEKIVKSLEELNKLRASNQCLQDKLNGKNNKLKNVETKKRKLMKDINRYKNLNQQIENSHSWRYTRPIRSVMDKIKK